MTYTPPQLDSVNFKLSDYSPPKADSVNFELGTADKINALVSLTGKGTLKSSSVVRSFSSVSFSAKGSLSISSTVRTISSVALEAVGRLSSTSEVQFVNYIDDVQITSINQIDVQSGESVEEVDLVDENTNMVLSSDNKGIDITINATLVEDLHVSSKSVKQQRDEIRELVENSPKDNTFYFEDMKGTLSIQSISVPESSSDRNLNEIQIRAKYLPYPKHNPNASWS